MIIIICWNIAKGIDCSSTVSINLSKSYKWRESRSCLLLSGAFLNSSCNKKAFSRKVLLGSTVSTLKGFPANEPVGNVWPMIDCISRCEDGSRNYTINHFKKEYSTDAACLDRIFKLRYKDLNTCPKCKQEATFTRIKTRPCYHCDKCYHQIYPTVGTIFEKSTTPLTSWFYAMYLFAISKNGLSAKELERHLGVTYKCAFRILHKIRSLLENDAELLNGVIEMDETFVGGKNINRHKDKKVKGCQGRSFKDKTPVFGMLQRGGNVKAFVVPNTNTESLLPHAFNHIEKGATVYTDEWYAYHGLAKEYTHGKIEHNKGQYADGDITTNRVENYWSNVKRTLKGCYITVSPKYLQNYVNECSFKYNHKGNKNLFNELLGHI